MKNQAQSSTELSVHTVTDNAAYLEYFGSAQGGMGFVPESYGQVSKGLKSEGADFAKWIKQKIQDFRYRCRPQFQKFLFMARMFGFR